GAAGLTHEPHRSGIDRLAPGGVEKPAHAIASIVASMTDRSCAADTNKASNCDGGRSTPASSMEWKKRAKAAVSEALASRKFRGGRSLKNKVRSEPTRATLAPLTRRPASRRAASCS